MHALDDTIAALASAPGGAARAIVRISGPAAIECLRACFQPIDEASWDSLTDRSIVVGHTADELRIPTDAYVWPDRRSYTRQPMVELHTIGSPPLVEHLLRRIHRAGARLAQPGEFTLRAFLAGRLDLTQAEAVLGVIDAQDRSQLSGALAQLAGGLSRPLHQLRSELLDLLADLEAGLDFIEEDIQFVTSAQLIERLTTVERALAKVAAQMQARGESSAAARVVLFGWPNTGKSSLFNALSGHDAAIVSSQSGTTRDYLVARLDVNGLPIELIDTAGVEFDFADDGITAAAQDLSNTQQRQSVVRILCLDSTRRLNAWETRILADFPLGNALRDIADQPKIGQTESQPPLLVLTKCDQPGGMSFDNLSTGDSFIRTSAVARQGLTELRAAIESRLAAGHGESNAIASTAARCSDSLLSAGAAVGRAIALATQQSGDELVSAELRAALEDLGRVVGAVYTNDLLDRIFSRFCIGK